MRKIAIALLFSFVTFPAIQSQEIVKPRSVVSFTVTNFGNDVEGGISGMKGEVSFDPEKPSDSYFDVSLDISTINTGIERRDLHLAKREFFHVSKYPEIRFVSEKVEKVKVGYMATGKLIMKGIERSERIFFNYEKKANSMILTGIMNIQRKDYDIGGISALSIGDDVRVDIVCILES